METTVELESSSVLGQLLTEMSEVFLKAEGYDDALAAAEYANEEADRLRAETVTYAERVLEQESEIERLQEQYAETCETLFVARKDAAALRAKLENQNYLFGEVLAHPPVGPGRKNRPKLTSAQVGGIRSMVGNGSTIASVAKVYGVHPSTVSRIASGVYHKGEEHA